MSRKKKSGAIEMIFKAIGMLYLYLFKVIFLMFKGICLGIKKLTEYLSKLSPEEKHKLIICVQWIFSIVFIFDGLGMMFGVNILFVFMAIFGLLINPKFNDIYVKITKKDPLKKTPRIIASVVSFLMIYVAMGVYGLTKDNDDKVSTVDNKQVFTEITTVSTTTSTTQMELTTTEPVETTTTEDVTTTKETTQEVTTETVKETSVTTKEKEEITTIETTQATTTTTTEKETEPPQIVETVPITNSYVLNTNTMKFHKQSCRDVKKISPENYDTFDGSRDEVINMGYDPCGHCNP